MPGFVNRALALRTSFLHDENGLVRPLSTGQELVVTPLRNEYVREHFVAAGRRVVVHSQAGRKKDPFPVVFRAEEILPGVSRHWGTGVLRRGVKCSKTKRKRQAQQNSVFHDLPRAATGCCTQRFLRRQRIYY